MKTKVIDQDKGSLNKPALFKRKYKPITDAKRKELLRYIHKDKMKIVQAAKLAGIDYENAKAINRVFRLQGRQMKKTACCNASNFNFEMMSPGIPTQAKSETTNATE